LGIRTHANPIPLKYQNEKTLLTLSIIAEYFRLFVVANKFPLQVVLFWYCSAMTMQDRQTEHHLSALTGIDTWEDAAILEAFADGQARALAAVRAAAPQISAAATLLAARLAAGGRLVYAGAGTSIRVAVQDGGELPATFGLAEDRIAYLIAGGRHAMFETLAAAEDDEDAASRDAANCTSTDTVIAVAASGQTPYTLAAARTARAMGAKVIAVVNNRASALEAAADIAIVLDSGAEVISGSTRMGAGTAQKAALNFLSTLTHIKLGAVHDGYMVNVEAGNIKLRRRAAGIVMAITGAAEQQAAAALEATAGAVKPAILICLGAASAAEAATLLATTNGNLRLAMARLSRP
jgi:N-acetylmuramic acid 6-phosphate etherase